MNALNFNREGNLLVSASDDLKIVIWDWAIGKKCYGCLSGHTSNMFQVCIDVINKVLYNVCLFYFT